MWNRVGFPDYNAVELLAILRDRARIGLHRPIEVAPAEIAELTVKTTNSDVRVAIKTLYPVALEDAEDVEAVISRPAAICSRTFWRI